MDPMVWIQNYFLVQRYHVCVPCSYTAKLYPLTVYFFGRLIPPLWLAVITTYVILNIPSVTSLLLLLLSISFLFSLPPILLSLFSFLFPPFPFHYPYKPSLYLLEHLNVTNFIHISTRTQVNIQDCIPYFPRIWVYRPWVSLGNIYLCLFFHTYFYDILVTVLFILYAISLTNKKILNKKKICRSG